MPEEQAVIRYGDSPANAGSENMPEEQGSLGSGPGNTDFNDSVQNSCLIAVPASTQTLSSPMTLERTEDCTVKRLRILSCMW